ncbi:DUF3857 domain-containing protein [Mangrovimonas sp. TPBH4]|uniref:DUF3857 domain-containing protein n=1 Tax=Mangrovimonas sp. TPBH4 TaxID=1645914 RepID=UPI0009EC76B9|nr:transglutaminase domain-containing protein [Mangrovimonas sp. TPBH4]
MKAIVAIFLIFLVSHISMAQEQDYDFGKVSKQQVEEKICPQDSSANAAILYKNEKIWFTYSQEEGFVQIREVHERIKIYNKAGYDWATRRVILYNRSIENSEVLTSLKGYTFNVVDGRLVRDKLKKEGVFQELANEYWKYESFTMPNVKEGSVIEYTYRIRSPYMQIGDIQFQYTIPMLKYDLKVSTPQYFNYNKRFNPESKYVPELEYSTSNGMLNLNSKDDRNRKWSTRPAFTNYQYSKLDYINNVIMAREVNIPALKEEPMLDNIYNYRAKLILELKSIEYPGEPIEYFASTWEDVTKNIYDLDKFGGQLNKSGYFKEDIADLLKDETSEFKKINLIYNYVKSKVKWNGNYGVAAENGVRKAYKEGVGNVADINLILVAMLREIGIMANPVLVSTKNNGIPLFPTRQGFNYVICVVENDEGKVLMDASSSNGAINVLPSRALHWQGRIVRKNGSSNWVQLKSKVMSEETTSMKVQIQPDLSISGEVRQILTNYMAMDYRDRFADSKDDELVKEFEMDRGDVVIENIQFRELSNTGKPLQISYNYQTQGEIEVIGETILLNPLLFFAESENLFKQEERSYPITLDFPIRSKYMVTILLPDGYELESMPGNGGSEFNNGEAKFVYAINRMGNYLQLLVNFDLNTTLVLPEDYEYFKDFIGAYVEKHNEKIVLKKII